jgi:hypothetical protein
MAWDVLERNLPRYRFVERHQRFIDTPPARVWQALHTARVEGSGITKTAIALRMWPARLAGRPTPPAPTLFDLSGMANFIRLGAIPQKEFVLGMVGQFWRAQGGLLPLEAAAFADFDDPAYAKLVFGFLLVPQSGGTLLKTETRVHGLSPASERRFWPYWLLIRPVSGMIRRQILDGIAQEAQRSPSAEA